MEALVSRYLLFHTDLKRLSSCHVCLVIRARLSKPEENTFYFTLKFRTTGEPNCNAFLYRTMQMNPALDKRYTAKFIFPRFLKTNDICQRIFKMLPYYQILLQDFKRQKSGLVFPPLVCHCATPMASAWKIKVE